MAHADRKKLVTTPRPTSAYMYVYTVRRIRYVQSIVNKLVAVQSMIIYYIVTSKL